jgi:hypothetical protein
MKILYIFSIILLLFAVSPSSLVAQTPWDAIFMGKRQLCVAAMYDHAFWNQYWEGEPLITNENIGLFQKSTVLPMVAYGIVDGLDFVASAPYIRTRSSGGQLAGVSGFQDLNMTLKGRIFDQPIGNGSLVLIGAASFATPVSNYLSDYMPYSLGLGCNEFGLRGTAEYRMNSSLYLRASAAHLWRGYTEIERAYYYEEGSYYSTFMNVPNAWSLHSALGWLHLDDRLRIELTYWGVKCTSGDDIRRWLRPQPTNKVMFDQVGLFAQYYFKRLNQVSLIAYANRIIHGRNTAQATNFTLGATYQFDIGAPRQLPN